MPHSNINIKKLTDEELIAIILKSGEIDLFGELYDRYGDRVFRKVISMLKDVELSKDITQEILIKTFLSLTKFGGKAKFSTWLYMVTYNYCIDYLRKKKKDILVKTDNDRDHAYVDDEKDEKEILEIELDRLDDLLEEIPTEDKSLLLMYYQDDMSIKDLEEYLDLGASAVKMRLARARKRLKSMYEAKYVKI